MTRKQFRKDKRQREFELRNPDPNLEKPLESDPEISETAQQTWKRDFLAQFAWYPEFNQGSAA